MMAQRGGKRAGAGRKKGAVSKAKLELAEMAKGHASEALDTLLEVMRDGEQESTRISAANAILDRGFGRPFQAANPGADGDDDAASMTIKITAAEPVGEIRVTRSDS